MLPDGVVVAPNGGALPVGGVVVAPAAVALAPACVLLLNTHSVFTSKRVVGSLQCDDA